MSPAFNGVLMILVLAAACGRGGQKDASSEEPARGVTQPQPAENPIVTPSQTPTFDPPGTSTGSSFGIVSDLDDTLRITNVQNFLSKISNAFSGTGAGAFAGMGTLLSAMSRGSGQARRFFLLSGTPTFLQSGVLSFIGGNQFPQPAQVFLRDGLGASSDGLAEFKMTKLREIIQSVREPLVLIGDDTEFDAHVYAQLAAQAPSQVAAIYIRSVKGAPPVSNREQKFLSAFDIAVSEFVAGRMSETDASAVGQSLLAADNKLVIPDFVICSSSPIAPSGRAAPLLEALYTQVTAKIQAACRK